MEAISYERDVQQREKERKLYLRKYNTEVVTVMAGEHDLEFKQYGDDHVQIKKGSRVLSFYPGTEKGLWVSNPKFHHLTRKAFRIKNIELFILEEFVGEEKKPKGQPPAPVIKTKREEFGECERGCGGSYVKRTNKAAATHFLGCSNYPKCKSTKQIFNNQ